MMSSEVGDRGLVGPGDRHSEHRGREICDVFSERIKQLPLVRAELCLTSMCALWCRGFSYFFNVYLFLRERDRDSV